ncbi:MAG TPA: LL-diaminopimelate aminotransferase [Phycisphaerae bacterium]|nr:LL-diaminopimelate aminotransferase [Phycisphaerae bacterium]
MNDWRADRLNQLPPYLFVEIDRQKRKAIAAGKDVIDFGVGDPDKPTPGFIIDRMAQAIRDPANHTYPFGVGVPEFRQAAAEFFARRFGVSLDPQTELVVLIGSKEGLGHLPLAVVNPGDTVLIPQPAYPAYQAATIFAGGKPYHLDLSEDRHWLPDLDAVPPDVCRAAKLMFLNYPNNPTGAFASLAFFEDAVAFARRHDILIAQDAAYSELYFEEAPPSILQIKGAADVAVEFHSLSKTFNMTGWRLAYVAGNRSALAALAQVKSNVDSGQFNAVQWAGQEALSHPDHVEVRAMLDVYRRRRDVVVEGLRNAGLHVARPAATFYVWARCPDGFTSMEFAAKLLDEAAVVVVPGLGFGRPGEGYFRMALTVSIERTREAMARLAEVRA